MGEDILTPPLILLGRPFMYTSKTIINVHEGTITMEFDGEIIKFNIHNSMEYSSVNSSIYGLTDFVDPLANDILKLFEKDEQQVASTPKPKIAGIKAVIRKYVKSIWDAH